MDELATLGCEMDKNGKIKGQMDPELTRIEIKAKLSHIRTL